MSNDYDWSQNNEAGGQMEAGEHEVYIGRVTLGNEQGPYKPDDGFPVMRIIFVNKREEEVGCFVSLGPKAHFPNRSIASLCRAAGNDPMELAKAGLRPIDFESDAVFNRYLAGKWLKITVTKSTDGRFTNVKEMKPYGAPPPASSPPPPATQAPLKQAPPINTKAPAPSVEIIDTSINSIEMKPYARPDGSAGQICVLVTGDGRFGIIDNQPLAQLANEAKAGNEIIRVHFTRDGKKLIVTNINRVERAAPPAADDEVPF